MARFVAAYNPGTNVAVGTPFVSDTIQASSADRVTGSIFSDQPGTLYIEQSPNGTNWDVSTSYTVTANQGAGFSEEVLLPNVRLRFSNTGAATTTVFRLYARFQSAGARP